MQRTRKIFDNYSAKTPDNGQTNLPDNKLDPFHQNYTVTGLIQHIESTLSDIISHKKDNQEGQEVDPNSEVDKL